MNWKDTLHAVRKIAPELTEAMDELIRAIDCTLEGHPDPELLAQVVGNNKGKELIASLDAFGRLHMKSGSSELIEPIWATLRGLRRIVLELERIQRTGSAPFTGSFSVREGLDRIEQAPSGPSATKLRCPRCHSRHVDLNREKVGDGRRLVEIKCWHCGLSDDRVTVYPTKDIDALPEWRTAD